MPHIHIKIEDALAWDDRTLEQMFHDESDMGFVDADSIRMEFRNLLRQGVKYVTSDSCNNVNPDGSCGCHKEPSLSHAPPVLQGDGVGDTGVSQ